MFVSAAARVHVRVGAPLCVTIFTDKMSRAVKLNFSDKKIAGLKFRGLGL